MHWGIAILTLCLISQGGFGTNKSYYFDLSAGGNQRLGYDDNIFQTPDVWASQEKESSFYYTIEPFIFAAFRHKRVDLSLYYAFSFTEYFDSEAGYTMFHFLKTDVRIPLHRRVFLNILYRFTNYSISFHDEEDYRINAVGLGLKSILHRQVQFSIQYLFSYREYYDVDQQNKEQKGIAQFDFPIAPVFRFYLGYQYTYTKSSTSTSGNQANQINSGLTIRPLPWMSILADYFFRHRDFSDRTDNCNGILGSVMFYPLRWLSVGVKGLYIDNIASQDTSDFSKWGVSLELALHYDKVLGRDEDRSSREKSARMRDREKALDASENIMRQKKPK